MCSASNGTFVCLGLLLVKMEFSFKHLGEAVESKCFLIMP